MSTKDYEKARKKYTPSAVRLLFVSEAPPASVERYFYHPHVLEHDWLWIALMRALYPREFTEVGWERPRKERWLARFCGDGCLLVNAVKEPLRKGLNAKKKRALILKQKDALIAEIQRISPRQVLLIKTAVYDTLYEPLTEAGLPVVDGRLPFPSTGKLTEFDRTFRRLVKDGALKVPQDSGD